MQRNSDSHRRALDDLHEHAGAVRLSLNVPRNASQIEVGCAPMPVQLAEVLCAYGGNATDYRDDLRPVLSTSLVPNRALL